MIRRKYSCKSSIVYLSWSAVISARFMHCSGHPWILAADWVEYRAEETSTISLRHKLWPVSARQTAALAFIMDGSTTLWLYWKLKWGQHGGRRRRGEGLGLSLNSEKWKITLKMHLNNILNSFWKISEFWNPAVAWKVLPKGQRMDQKQNNNKKVFFFSLNIEFHISVSGLPSTESKLDKSTLLGFPSIAVS